MTGVAVFTAYRKFVPSMFLNCGSPSYSTDNWAWLRVMVAVCGMAFAISASLAGPVPGTDTNTPAFGLLSGIAANSSGRYFPSTNSHRPLSKEFDRDHRPGQIM